MKLSKFNIYMENEEGSFIYNTFSGSVIKLNEKYTEKYKLLMKNQCVQDDEFINNLLKGNILIKDDIDEISCLLASNNLQRFSSQTISYTIAPSLNCNFRCPYCYEDGANYSTMNFEVIEKLEEVFLQAKDTYKYLSITWYGGEPLLEFDTIERLSQSAIKIFGEENYFANIVTNGYLLTPKISNQLKELRILSLQVTIDGPPDIHNKRRRLPNEGDTFFVILKNIQYLISIYPEIQVTIRVNTDKENIDSISEIFDYLSEYELKTKVGLYLAPVEDVNGSCNNSQCFNNTEFASEQIKFIENNYKNVNKYTHLPQRNLYVCGAIAGNSFVIDPLGDIYKCWNDVGFTEKKAGNLFDTSPLNSTNFTKWLSYSILEDKECLNCEFLPVCAGGCPYYRLEKGVKKCVPIKENSKKMIELLYKLKKNKNIRR